MNAKYVDRIQALLAKAESTTPEEAELLTAKAEELMLKYGIEQAMLESRSGVKAEQIVKRHIDFEDSYGTQRMMAAHHIAQAYGNGSIRTLKMTLGRAYHQRLYLIGFESDVDQAILLINSLNLQAAVALRAWWSGFADKKYLTSSEQYIEKRTFIEKFGMGAAHRITASRAKVVEESGTGTELVLRDRASLVDDWMRENQRVGKARASRASQGYYGGGAGYRAGKNANVGQKGVGGGRKAVSG
jgi:Protein of unknown function (DUF2786)